jgi:hypothetical protein
MAPDFEMAAFARERDLVFDMFELRIAGTPEIDAGMEHIQGVKRGRAGQGAAAPAARPAAAAAPAARTAPGPVAGRATGATASPTSTQTTGTQVAEPKAAPQVGVPAGQGTDATAAAAQAQAPNTAAAPTDYDPLTISDEDLKKLPPAERAKVYKARNPPKPPAPRA